MVVTRPYLIKAVAAGGVTAALPNLTKAYTQGGSPPDILCQVSEPHSAFFGCYGAPVAQASVIDGWAARPDLPTDRQWQAEPRARRS
jgi:hypothetical protein